MYGTFFLFPWSFPLQISYIFRTLFSLSIGSFNFLVEAAEEVFEIIAGLFFISRLQFVSVAVKHNSSIAAFAMADGF